MAETIIKNTDFNTSPLLSEYENYRFINCNFQDADISDIQFTNCEFASCDLSMAKLNQTAFWNVTFNDCKLLGIHFENSNKFAMTFRFNNCLLNHSSFYQTKIKKTVFTGCRMLEVDFTDCDLSEATFDNCDLSGAVFINSRLFKADFTTSFHYAIDPENNYIKKARFSLNGISGLLNKYDIEIF